MLISFVIRWVLSSESVVIMMVMVAMECYVCVPASCMSYTSKGKVHMSFAVMAVSIKQ